MVAASESVEERAPGLSECAKLWPRDLKQSGLDQLSLLED